MPEFTVHFTKFVDIGIKVEADDYEAAIEAAYEEGAGGICAQCSGWGQQWSRDEGDEMEPESVTGPDGDEVWVTHERWTRTTDGAE